MYFSIYIFIHAYLRDNVVYHLERIDGATPMYSCIFVYHDPENFSPPFGSGDRHRSFHYGVYLALGIQSPNVRWWARGVTVTSETKGI